MRSVDSELLIHKLSSNASSLIISPSGHSIDELVVLCGELFGNVKAFRATHALYGFFVVVSVEQFLHNLSFCCFSVCILKYIIHSFRDDVENHAIASR